MDLSTILSTGDGGINIRVKVVPGASRTRIAGILGDRLKVVVAAPPEDGKANRQLCDHMARMLGLPRRGVRVTSGRAQPMKTLEVVGLSLHETCERIARRL